MQHEIVTETIEALLLRPLLPGLADLLRSLPLEPLTIEFGWGSYLATSELWRPVAIAPGNVAMYLREQESKGIISIGESDVILRANNFFCTVCHESDIHFVSRDEAFLQAVTKWISEQGYRSRWRVYSTEQREWEDIATRPSLAQNG